MHAKERRRAGLAAGVGAVGLLAGLLAGMATLPLPRARRRGKRGRRGALGAIARLARRAPGPAPLRLLGVDLASRRYLLYAVLPLWIGVGLFDWVCHRRTKIEETSGPLESAIHGLMMTEIGLPVLAGLFLDVNALVLGAMVATFFAHEATAAWDVSYAETRREVTPTEQHVHSFLEVLPFMTVSFLLILHWDQALALVGRGPEPARFTLRLKRPPLSPRYVAGILGAVGAFIALPYAEEFVRCYRAQPTLAPLPALVPEGYGVGPAASVALSE